MFDNDEILKVISYDHRLKIIQEMKIIEYQNDQTVFFKYTEKSNKLAFCMKGSLIDHDNDSTFLKEGQIFGSKDMYYYTRK